MSTDDLHEELLGLLGGRRGHFRLESGHHGDLWLDLELLFLRPTRLRRFAAALARRFAGLAVEAVCGPLVGGAFLAQAVAAELDVEFYHTERVAPADGNGLYAATYRLPDTLRHRIAGKNVAVVDDAINAGSAVRATCLELRASGARPVCVGALLVLGPLAAKLADDWNVPLETIACLPNEPWRPEACPLCASGVPLEDVPGRESRRENSRFGETVVRHE
jgi:orotate phosphoribosyltransferase